MTSRPAALEDRVSHFARTRFGEDASVERISGDASDRAYFRLRLPSLASLMLMVHTEPFELSSQPWFLHGRFLHDIGAAVPQVVASFPAEGILVIQDLGDDMLQTHLGQCDTSRRRFLYLQAAQILAFLQEDGTRALTPDLPAYRDALDRDRLLFELRFFADHYARGLKVSALGDEQAAALDGWFEWLAAEVAGYRRVLCHRDFHSRNLMVKGDRLYLIDFQDARMGAYTYDLASLLRDSYVDLPQDLVTETLDFFREATRAPEPLETFQTSFRRTSLQRNIKALGTFASQVVLRNNRVYLPYIPRTLAHIRENLEAEVAQAVRSNGVADPEAVLELFSGPLDYR